MQNETLASSDTIPEATAEQRQRGKCMSRRSGQSGTIVKEGGWYRVRFRVDVPGRYERKQMSVRICPVSGPDVLTKSERERRKIEIVNSHGANPVERFNQVVALETGQTFGEQAKEWLHQCMIRKRKPVKLGLHLLFARTVRQRRGGFPGSHPPRAGFLAPVRSARGRFGEAESLQASQRADKRGSSEKARFP
jgi:hypothetical protein